MFADYEEHSGVSFIVAIGISLLVHACLFALWASLMERDAAHDRPSSYTVSLVEPPPLPAPKPVPMPKPAPRPAPARPTQTLPQAITGTESAKSPAPPLLPQTQSTPPPPGPVAAPSSSEPATPASDVAAPALEPAVPAPIRQTPAVPVDILDPAIIEAQARVKQKAEESAAPEGALQQEDGITFDTGEMMYAGYMQLLKEKIEGIWVYPREAARRGISGDLIIKFVIKKDGTLGSARVLKTSGYAMLDRAALKALEDGVPYWPLPGNWPSENLTIQGRFIYTNTGYYVR